MTAPTATKPPEPPQGSVPHGPTFLRRHPILAGFGILAGVSLFAAYFPISAIVTAVVVGAHATGADRLALRAAERAGSWLARHLPRHHTSAPPSPPAAVAAGQLQRRRIRPSPDVSLGRRAPQTGRRMPIASERLPRPSAHAPAARRPSPRVPAGRDLDGL